MTDFEASERVLIRRVLREMYSIVSDDLYSDLEEMNEHTLDFLEAALAGVVDPVNRITVATEFNAAEIEAIEGLWNKLLEVIRKTAARELLRKFALPQPILPRKEPG